MDVTDIVTENQDSNVKFTMAKQHVFLLIFHEAVVIQKSKVAEMKNVMITTTFHMMVVAETVKFNGVGNANKHLLTTTLFATKNVEMATLSLTSEKLVMMVILIIMMDVMDSAKLKKDGNAQLMYQEENHNVSENNPQNVETVMLKRVKNAMMDMHIPMMAAVICVRSNKAGNVLATQAIVSILILIFVAML